MGKIREEIYRLLLQDHPMTVRQVFYQLVSRAVTAKTEQEYKATVVRLLTDMRLSGEIPFGWIADNTRWMRKPQSYSSLEAALSQTAQCYRRSVWDQQPAYVEIWCEKDALAGVLYEETEIWDVPLMVTRGYASVSFLHGAAQAIQAQEKPAFIYYLGDFDPSGVNISRDVERKLSTFSPNADIHFQRIAVTLEQISVLRLPTRPTKKSDPRSKGFDVQSVELDAIPPRTLRELVHEHIEQHVDQQALQTLKLAEAEERSILRMFAGGERMRRYRAYAERELMFNSDGCDAITMKVNK
jgi:hypothetical protein